MSREPVLTAAAVSGLIMAFFAMAVSLGWLALSPEQMDAVRSFVLPAVGIAGPLIAAWWARGRVTPVASPKTLDGKEGVIVPRADLTPQMAQQLGVDARQL